MSETRQDSRNSRIVTGVELHADSTSSMEFRISTDGTPVDANSEVIVIELWHNHALFTEADLIGKTIKEINMRYNAAIVTT